MGSMFGSGFDTKQIGQFVEYLRQIFDMLINLIKSLSGKSDATEATEATETPADGQ